jgi:nucleoside 2-deoxyribosyltransferase
MSDEASVRTAKKRCFVITPIGSDQSHERRHANMVFEIALKLTLEKEGFSLERADLGTEPGQITAAIFSALNEADFCIADLTFLNANVMYELGVRHALQKPVVQIASANTRLPFDAANQRTLFFDAGDAHSLQKLGNDILNQLKWIEAHPDQVSNPLTAALGIFANAASADSQSEVISQLVARVRAVEAKIGTETAPAIIGQGDLATRSMQDLKRLWRADQAAHLLEWTEEGGGTQASEYKGFIIRIRPESKGRWSSFAVEKGADYSVPWPVWQSSADDAKSTIIRAVDAALAER